MLSTSTHRKTRQCLIDLCWMTILFGIFYALWIGSYPLFTPDEGRYSEIAREMIVTHDYVTPRLNGVAFLDKPILYYWLQASAIKLFGLKESALRFWPACLGVLGCLMTYLGGHLLFDRRTGILAAIILLTCPLYYGAAHYANLDLEVAVWISSALLCFLIGIQSPVARQKTGFLLAAYVIAALAVLTKGLIGIVFPMMIIGCWISMTHQWAILKKMHLVSGLLIFFVLTLPWYILVQQANPQFLHFFFVTQQVERFLTQADFNNRTPVWFYVPIILTGLLPWTIFLLQALAQAIKLTCQHRKHYANHVFLLSWFFIIFIFFSIPKSKTIGYILPVFPALALLIGNYLSKAWDDLFKTKGVMWGSISFVLLCGLVTGICLFAPSIKSLEIPATLFPYLECLTMIFLIAGIVSCVLLYQRQYYKIIYCIGLTASLFLLALITSADVINQKSIKPLAMVLNTHLTAKDEIVTYFKYYQDLPLYTQHRVTVVADWQASDIPRYDNWQRELWYGMPFQDTKEWLIDTKTFLKRWNSKKRLFVLINNGLYEQFTHLAIKHKIYKLSENNDVILISNKK